MMSLVRVQLGEVVAIVINGFERTHDILVWECGFSNPFKSRLAVSWLRGQAVKTSPFHGGNTGSIPVGVTYIYGSLAQLVRASGS